MISNTQVLCGSKQITGATRLPVADLAMDWCESVTFIVSVRTIGGSPTDASLAVKFQYLNPQRFGANQYEFPEWRDFEPNQVDKFLLEGMDWANPVATTAGSLPRTAQRTINKGFGYSTSILLTPTFTGGTNPYYEVTASMIMRG